MPRFACLATFFLTLVLLSVPAQGACPDFAYPAGYGAGKGPQSVTTGDFNGDGAPDVAVVNEGSDNISVLLGDGDGTLTAAVHYTVGSQPRSIGTADFNLDGSADLVVANFGDDTVSVLLGAGDGTFGPASHYAVEDGPVSVAIGDFSRDGKPDLAVANGNSNNISILLGMSPSGFSARTTFGVGRGASFLAAGDFNNDGRLDLAVANDDPFEISIVPGNGDGTFSSAVAGPAVDGPLSIVLGDFDRDGNLDMAIPTGITGTDDVAVLLGNGNHTFSAPTYVDVNNDPQMAAAADFDGDGYLDLVVGRVIDDVAILMNNGFGGFDLPLDYFAGAGARAVAVADFDSDGKPDVVSANQGENTVAILLNTAVCAVNCGKFGVATTWGAGDYPSLAVGDVNGDGNPDVVTANWNASNVTIILGNGMGVLSAAGSFPVGSGPSAVALGDFNRDGRVDLAVTNFSSQNVSILISDGPLSYAAAVNYPMSGQVSAIVVGDLNGDAMEDLVVGNASSLRVQMLAGNGDGTFDPPVLVATGFRPFGVEVADFNGDGKADVAASDNDSNNVVVILGNGNGTFQPKVNYAVGGGTIGSVAADFNDDGHVDLAFPRYSMNDVAILLGDGSGAFGPATYFPAGLATGAYEVDAADFDGNGTLDLVIVNNSSDSLSILPGNGDGTFGTGVVYAAQDQPRSLGIADFNKDGKPDVVVANQASDSLSVLLNSCPTYLDLRITKTHSEFFMEGDVGRTYTISVANIGGTTSGPVYVLDSLPPSLTATAIGGAGWTTCTLSPLACQRTDPLAGGSTYPPITLTVNVSSDSPAQVVNTVSVSVAGDSISSNNTATDPTQIGQTPPPAPANFTAVATSATEVSLNWDASNEADLYLIRRLSSTGLEFSQYVSMTSYTDAGAAPGKAYVYSVAGYNSVAGNGPMSRDVATTIAFTDDPIVAGTTVIKAVHPSELQAAVNLLREAAGLSPATFGGGVGVGLAVAADSILELRSRLGEARVAVGLPHVAYANPGLAAGSTCMAIDINELRAGMR